MVGGKGEMAKRFRLRISRAIPSFHSCRSKDDAAALPVSPVFRLSPVNPKALDTGFPLTPSPLLPPLHSRPFRNHVPVVFSSAGCGCRSPKSNRRPRHPSADADADDLSLASETPAYLWRKEDKWHIVARVEPPPRRKIDSDDGERELFPPLSIRRRRRKNTKKKRKSKSSRSRARISTSSTDSHWFSSEEEYEEDYNYDCNGEEEVEKDGETETLISSSRSFSTDYSSSDFNSRLKPISESVSTEATTARRRRLRHQRRCVSFGGAWGRAACPSPETDTPVVSEWGSSVLRRLTTPPCRAVEGKVRESFAVVKRSEDPYGDFRKSMVEMVVEKQLYEERDLEQLLRCFLSLNSGRHHPAIVRAFSEIWDALFPASSSSLDNTGTTAPTT